MLQLVEQVLALPAAHVDAAAARDLGFEGEPARRDDDPSVFVHMPAFRCRLFVRLSRR